VPGWMVRWAIELSEFDVQYEPRGPIKGQVYADFVVELFSAAAHQEETYFRMGPLRGRVFQPIGRWGWRHFGRAKWVTDRAGPTVHLQG